VDRGQEEGPDQICPWTSYLTRQVKEVICVAHKSRRYILLVYIRDGGGHRDLSVLRETLHNTSIEKLKYFSNLLREAHFIFTDKTVTHLVYERKSVFDVNPSMMTLLLFL
jgi:hypothetical protein